VIQHDTIARSRFYALRDIKEGEEVTYDYGVNAMDPFDNLDFVMKCNCGAPTCRKNVHTNFFMQPIAIQRKYYCYLPPSIRRKYKKQFAKLHGID
jgi:hypothetical protein